MRHRICATWVVAAAAVGLLASVAEARPAKLSCGQVLTASVRLTADLTNCPSDGLVVRADGITIDLDGHTLDGVPTTADCGPPFPAPYSGVSVGGYDYVTVKNGTIQQFNTGVSGGADTITGISEQTNLLDNGQAGMSDSRIHDLVLRDNRFDGVSMGGNVPASTARNRVDHNVVSGGASCSTGLDLNTGVGNRFDDNRVTDVGTGISICCRGDGNVVADNRISRTEDRGILVFDTGTARVVDNTLSDIGAGGIEIIYAASSGTLVAGNRLTRVASEGIGVFGCVDPNECSRGPEIPTGVRVVDDVLEATGDGIFLANTDGDVVRGNTITHAARSGPPDNLGDGVGIVLDGVSDTLVAANHVADGGRGPAAAIYVGVRPVDGPSPRPVSRNTVARNSVERQSGDGIFVAALATGTTLLGNEADRNGADGIHVLSAATTLARNQADRNVLFGIEAVAGVTDGGGNRARGNGTSPQCTGVVC